MNEIWRSIKDYEGLYEVSNWGRVRNVKTGLIMKLTKATNGYLYVNLCKNGIVKLHLVHRLVAMMFPDMVDWTEEAKGKPFEVLEVNHKDENPVNCRFDNLEFCNHRYNSRYTLFNGKTSKHVYQYTLDGQLVREWPSTQECGRNGYTQGSVADCCRGERKTHKGFKWSYNPPQ